jgi:hypothetical protein
MNEFYVFGKFIRQDELRDGAIVASRWLQPSATEEEKETLNPLCDARFRRQQTVSTVTSSRPWLPADGRPIRFTPTRP